MNPNSQINEVHTTFLQESYKRVTTYLCDPRPSKRRSYLSFLNTVYELKPEEKSIAFQSECLLPINDRGRLRVLLLFSNAHPGSIRNGMFHTAESGVAYLWIDLSKIGVFSVPPILLKNSSTLRAQCVDLGYDGPFAFGFGCYWIFPTFHPDHLKRLFGKAFEPPGFQNTKERFEGLLKTWHPKAVVSFNKQVFEELTHRSAKGYTKQIRTGIFTGEYNSQNETCRIFQTFPASWRYDKEAPRLRRESLKRIFDVILKSP